MDFETQLKLHKLWDAKETTPTLPAKSQPVAQDYQDPAGKPRTRVSLWMTLPPEL